MTKQTKLVLIKLLYLIVFIFAYIFVNTPAVYAAAHTSSVQTASYQESQLITIDADSTFTQTLMLVFVAADNPLGQEGLDGPPRNNIPNIVDEIKKGMHPEIIVLLIKDGPNNNDSSFLRFEWDEASNCKLGMEHPCDDKHIADQQSLGELQEYGPILDEFIQESMLAYPEANKIILSIVGHGNGWGSAPTQKSTYLGIFEAMKMTWHELLGTLFYDQNSNDIPFSLKNFQDVLEGATEKIDGKIDLLYLNACSMAMVEVAYGLHHSTDYLLASQDIAWASVPYSEHISDTQGALDIQEIATLWIENEKLELAQGTPYAYSLIDLQQMETLLLKINRFSDELIAALPNYHAEIMTILIQNRHSCFISDYGFDETSQDDSYDYCDIGNIADVFASGFDNTAVGSAAQDLKTHVTSTIILNEYGISSVDSEDSFTADDYPGDYEAAKDRGPLFGLNIYSPFDLEPPKIDNYSNTHVPSWLEYSRWDEFIQSFRSRLSPIIVSLGDDLLVEQGEQFPVIVALSSLPLPEDITHLVDRQVGAVTLRLTYDPNVIRLTSCIENPSNIFDLGFCNSTNLGEALFNAASSYGVPITSTIANLLFQATGNTGDNVLLTIEVKNLVDIYGQPMSHTVHQQEISIAPSGPGDVNCDNSVDIIDALFVFQSDVSLRQGVSGCPLANPSTMMNIDHCDVNGDNACNSTDGLFITQCASGMDKSYCNNISSLGRNIQSSTTIAVQNLAELLQIHIELDNAERGTRITLPVTVDVTDDQLGAATFELIYDPSILQPVACHTNPGGHFNAVTCNINYAEGITRFSVISTEGVLGTDIPMVDLAFDVIGEPNQQTALDVRLVTSVNPSGTPIESVIQGGQMTVLGDVIYIPLIKR